MCRCSKLIIIIWFGDTVTVSHPTKCNTNSKVRRNWFWLCDDVCVLPWWFFCGGCADAKNLCQSLILAAIKEYPLNASVVKLSVILLEILTSFAAFAGNLASIHNFRSVDRRHETKINQNLSAVTVA